MILDKGMSYYNKIMRENLKKLFAAFLLITITTTLLFARQKDETAAAKSYKFVNGRWFDGKKFKRKVFYSVKGIFAEKRPAKIDEIVDLQNRYVVPPFADVHCHHFDAPYNVAKQIEMYLRDGVFYAKVQTDVRSGALKVADKVNIPTSVDVSYAHGALTHTFGHGIEIYEALALNLFGAKAFEANKEKIAASRLRENDAYYIIDTTEDLENKWQKILDGKPDFIKIYLLTSEDFEKKRENIPNIRLGNIGLDPKTFDSYVGRYQFGSDFFVPGRIYTIEKRNDQLFITTKGLNDNLTPQSETEFFNRTLWATTIFVKNDKGEVTNLIWRYGGRDYKANKL